MELMAGIGQREAFIAALITAAVGMFVFVVFLFAPAPSYVLSVAQPLGFLTGGLFVHGYHVLGKLDDLAENEVLNHREAERLGLIVEEYENRLRALMGFQLILTLLNAITPWIVKAVSSTWLVAIVSLTLNIVAVASVFFVHMQSAEISRFKRDIGVRKKRRASQEKARSRIKRD